MNPRIAVSLSFEAPDPNRHLFKGKSLQYIEQEMVHAVFRAHGTPFLIPFWGGGDNVATFSESLRGLDGLLLTGGGDIAPESYGESARHRDWEGDLQRDQYEIGLLREALRLKLPVLGVCRGCQLINVALGGSLYQDLPTEFSGSQPHRDQELYDKLSHPIEIDPDSLLGGIQGGMAGVVNSVHHQGLKKLGDGLTAVARAPDGVIEAVEGEGRFLMGVQWHPEWLPKGSRLGGQVFEAFIQACFAE